MKSLKLPAPIDATTIRMASDEMFFLDLTIMTNELPGELYRRVFITNETQVSAQRKAAALMSSVEGKTYIEKRRRQLEEWYFPEQSEQREGITRKAKTKTIEEALNDLQPTFIEELYATMQNRNDPNFGDTMKVFLAKSLKDIQMDKTAVPPLRYLPEFCPSSCRYRLFVEQNCEDECARCKYKSFGEENGLHLDYKTQLKASNE